MSIKYGINLTRDAFFDPFLWKEPMNSNEEVFLSDRYCILRLLGEGGSSKVYLAEHLKLKTYRAIKCISKSHPLQDRKSVV